MSIIWLRIIKVQGQGVGSLSSAQAAREGNSASDLTGD